MIATIRISLLALATAGMAVSIGACSGEDERRSSATQPAAQDADPWDQLKQGVQQTAGAVKEIARRTRDEFQRDFSDELKKLETRIGQLKEQAAAATEDARKRLNEEIGKLEQHKESARQALDSLKSAGKESLDKMRDTLGERLDTLRRASDTAPATAPADPAP